MPTTTLADACVLELCSRPLKGQQASSYERYRALKERNKQRKKVNLFYTYIKNI